MKKSKFGFPVIVALFFVCTLMFGSSAMAQDSTGGNVNVHNKIGREIDVFLFVDPYMHIYPDGGTQVAHIKDGESAVVHVSNCDFFSLLFVEEGNVWFAKFNDCVPDFTATTDISFSRRYP